LEEYVEHLRDDDGIVPADEDKDTEEMPTYAARMKAESCRRKSRAVLETLRNKYNVNVDEFVAFQKVGV